MNRFFLRMVDGIAIGLGLFIAVMLIQMAYRYSGGFSFMQDLYPETVASSIGADSTPAKKTAAKKTEAVEANPESNLAEELDNLYKQAEKYRWGNGVEKNHAHAVKLYREAAEKGHVDSQVDLAFMLRNGYGAAQDYEEAFRWYTAAAEKGNTQAIGNIGWMYRKGYGVPINYQKAYENSLIAAKDGVDFAMAEVGYLYEEGLYVGQSDEKAREWYEKGKAAGDDYSARKIRDGW